MYVDIRRQTAAPADCTDELLFSNALHEDNFAKICGEVRGLSLISYDSRAVIIIKLGPLDDSVKNNMGFSLAYDEIGKLIMLSKLSNFTMVYCISNAQNEGIVGNII